MPTAENSTVGGMPNDYRRYAKRAERNKQLLVLCIIEFYSGIARFPCDSTAFIYCWFCFEKMLGSLQ